MREYEAVFLSKSVVARLISLKDVVQYTDNPTLNEIIQSMLIELNILKESDVALIWNGFGYEMINRTEVEEP
jgi:hypothetical protein